MDDLFQGYFFLGQFVMVFVVLGMKVFVHGGAATPVPLLEALARRGKEAQLKNIDLFHIHTEGTDVFVEPECEGKQSLNFHFILARSQLNMHDFRVKF